MSERARQFILLFGDALAFYAALALALSIRNQALVDAFVWSQHWRVFTGVVLIWLAGFYIAGLYTLVNMRNDLAFYRHATTAMGVNILLAVAFFYIIPSLNIAPKTILLLTGGLYFALFLAWRRLLHGLVASAAHKRRVLMIGQSRTARELVKLLDNNPQLGYEVVAIFAHDSDEPIGNVPDYKDFNQLRNVIEKHRVSLVVMDGKSRDSGVLIENLYRTLPLGLEFLSLTQFYEVITKRVPLEAIDQTWFLENLQESRRRLFDTGKRILDIVSAILVGIPSLVLAPFIIFLILVANGWPIFFTQKRLGRHGRVFWAIKFRTMVEDAEKDGPQWTKKNDPRVTGFGRFLRLTRLDEIPQLWNILRGEMSFVGPRPERPEFVEQLEKEIPFYRDRLLIKPGLTGWAQVNFSYGASVSDSVKKLQYDLYYVKNRSLVLDLAIILRTIKTVVSAGGR